MIQIGILTRRGGPADMACRLCVTTQTRDPIWVARDLDPEHFAVSMKQ